MMQVLRMVLAVTVLGCSAGSMALQDGKVNEEVVSWGPLTLIVLVVLMCVVCMMKKNNTTQSLCVLLAAGVLGVSVYLVIDQSQYVDNEGFQTEDGNDKPKQSIIPGVNTPTKPIIPGVNTPTKPIIPGVPDPVKPSSDAKNIPILNVSAGAVGMVLGAMVLLEAVMPMASSVRRRRAASPKRGRK